MNQSQSAQCTGDIELWLSLVQHNHPTLGMEGLREETLEETFSQILRANFYLTTSEAFMLFIIVANARSRFSLEIV